MATASSRIPPTRHARDGHHIVTDPADTPRARWPPHRHGPHRHATRAMASASASGDILESRFQVPRQPGRVEVALGHRNLSRVALLTTLAEHYRDTMSSTTSIRASSTAPNLPGLGLALAGGLLGGALDLTFAFVYYGPSGTTPLRILQFIASGVLGQGSFQMGLESAALGAFFHFFISLCAAAIYYLASLRLPFLTRRVVISGIVFGILVFLTMRGVVLPLSAIKAGPMKISSIIGELCSHMFLFGIPIAYAASRAVLRRPK